MGAPYEGGCQCGKIRYVLKNEPVDLYACNCTGCQQQSGSAFGLSMIVEKESFNIKGELKSFVRTADSGSKVTAYFCPECGNRIYGISPFKGDKIVLKPGTLDDTSWLRPSRMIWMKSAQNWVKVPENMITQDTQ